MYFTIKTIDTKFSKYPYIDVLFLLNHTLHYYYLSLSRTFVAVDSIHSIARTQNIHISYTHTVNLFVYKLRLWPSIHGRRVDGALAGL